MTLSTLSTPSPHQWTRPVRCRGGARVEGRSGRPVRRVDGEGQCALELVNGRDEGIVRGVRFEEGRSPTVWRGHHVLVLGGRWRLESLDVRDAVHDGIAVQGGDVYISDLRGDGCGRGELVVVGGGDTRVVLEGAGIYHLHDEIEYPGEPSRTYRHVSCEVAGLAGYPRQHGGSIAVERLMCRKLLTVAYCKSLVASGVDCQGSFVAVNPDAAAFSDSGFAGGGLLRLQTQWSRGLDQRLGFDRCTFGAPLDVRGEGRLDFNACEPPPMGPWVRIDALAWADGPIRSPTAVEIYVDGELAHTLTAVGQTWRPS